MKICVTGAAGFVGSHLAERLLSEGHEVVGIDAMLDYYSLDIKKLNASDVEQKGGKMANIDLASDDLAEVLSGVEVVFHLAAQPGISDHVPFDPYVRNNLVATHRLLESLKTSASLKGFVNISTSSVYGQHATDNEETPPKPTSYYGVTKLAAEQLVLSYQREKQFPAFSMRLFSVYGPRERPEKLYPRLIKSILNNTPFPLYEGSEFHSRTFTYIDDILDGFVAALNNLDQCIGEIFNIGSDIEITTQRGIEIIEEILGKKAIIERLPKRAGDQLKTHADITKIHGRLGYQPKTPPEVGLAKEVEWYKNRIHGKIDYV